MLSITADYRRINEWQRNRLFILRLSISDRILKTPGKTWGFNGVVGVHQEEWNPTEFDGDSGGGRAGRIYDNHRPQEICGRYPGGDCRVPLPDC